MFYIFSNALLHIKYKLIQLISSHLRKLCIKINFQYQYFQGYIFDNFQYSLNSNDHYKLHIFQYNQNK